MKKHPFIKCYLNSTVFLSTTERKNIEFFLSLASEVLKNSKKIDLIPNHLKNMEISILICGDVKIKKLNTDFRNKEKVTDVLSFPAHENLRKVWKKDLKTNEDFFLGDLAICFPQAKRQAKEFKITPMDEFIHLFFHGILHLLGYDHEISRAEEKKMEKLEDWCLTEFSRLKKKGA